MFTDSQEIDTPIGFARFIKNALLTNTLGAAENEPGFSKFFDALPAAVIGVHVIQDSAVFLTTDNETCNDAGYSGIGILDASGTFTDVLTSSEISGLNFCRTAPMQSEHYINFAGERVLSFIDDINVPRIINLDNPQVDDVNDLLLFPFSVLPTIATSVREVGGSLETGTYYITFKYKNIDGAETNWFTIDGPLYVNDDRTGGGFTQYDGAIAGTASSKSIEIQFTDTDSNYDQIVLGAIKEIGGVTTAVELSTLTNSSTINTVYTGSETSTEITLAEILVGIPSYTNAKAITQLNNRLYLGNMQTEDVLDYQLYANQIKVNYTTKLIETATLDTTSHKLNGDKGLTPGEVYALYISFLLTDGSYSRAYHIPGRPSALRSGGSIPVVQAIESFKLATFPYDPVDNFTTAIFPASAGDFTAEFPSGTDIEIYDSGLYTGTFYILDSIYESGQTNIVFDSPWLGNSTGNITRIAVSSPVYETDISTKADTRGLGDDIPIFRVENTANNTNAQANTGFWENENELYPIGFPGLEGQNVRHHKMPTLRALYEEEGTVTKTGVSTHNIIGLDVTNITIPADIKERIQGYQIFYAKKSLGNSIVITHDRLELVGTITAGDNLGESMPSGGNWDVRPIGESYDNNNYGDQLRTPDRTKHVSSALDLIYDFPPISPNYIDLQYRIGTSGLNTTYTAYNGPGTQVAQNGADGDNYPMADALDYASNQDSEFSYLLTDDEFMGITNFKYIPGGALDIDLNNTRSPGVAYWEVVADSQSAMAAIPLGNIPSWRPKSPSGATFVNWDDAYGTTAEMYVLSINNLLTDVHNALTAQDLVATDIITTVDPDSVETIFSTSDIYGGDSFMSYQTVIQATSPTNRDEYWNDPSKDQYQNPRVFNGWTVPSRNNWNFRHQIDGDVSTWYYPKVDALDFFDPDNVSRPRTFLPGEDWSLYNKVEYNSDYSSINELQGMIIYDPTQRFQTEFPNLIIRSEAQASESLIQSWRSFLATDRYITDRSKGPITNLQGVANEQLIIHLEDTLFITRDRTTLSNDIDASRISLGAGDIFDLTPRELVTSENGHAGTQHRYSCKLTKLGYVFTDVKQGKVFLLRGFTDLELLSIDQQNRYFKLAEEQGIPFAAIHVEIDN